MIHGENQQERLQNICWLAGIIDGEGSITILKQSYRNKYVPRINIVNTNKKILDKVVEVLKENGLAFHYSIRKATNTWKIRGQINIDGMKRTKRALEVFIPYLVGKEIQAKLLLEYIKQRQAKPIRSPHEDDDIFLVNKIRELNRSGFAFSPTTNTSNTAYHAVKIESELYGNI